MLVTSIGSLPFTDVERAIDAVLEFCPAVPFWPQLPKRSFYERMYVQCLEGVPAVMTDGGNETMYMDTLTTKGIEGFYENVYSGNLEAFAISELAAPGFYRLLQRLREVRDRVAFIKGQLVGPFTIGMGLKDANGRPIIYDAAYFDIIKKALRMKAEWMIKTVRNEYPEKDVILFFDEPAMVSFGSAYVSLSREDVTSLLNEVVVGLDAMVGVHCCGNTDWSVLFNSGVDVINYDAFKYMETPFYFRDEVRAFLGRGGRIVPGIVPSTSEELSRVNSIDLDHLWSRFEGLISEIEGAVRQDWIATTACGLGSLAESDAYKALELLNRFPGNR